MRRFLHKALEATEDFWSTTHRIYMIRDVRRSSIQPQVAFEVFCGMFSCTTATTGPHFSSIQRSPYSNIPSNTLPCGCNCLIAFSFVSPSLGTDFLIIRPHGLVGWTERPRKIKKRSHWRVPCVAIGEHYPVKKHWALPHSKFGRHMPELIRHTSH